MSEFTYLFRGRDRTASPEQLVGGYGPAQSAKESLTRSLSVELAPHGIRVVGLRPQGMPESLRKAAAKRQKLDAEPVE